MIEAAGIRSIDDPRQIRQILGWNARIGSCMAIPFRKLDGSRMGYARLRTDTPRVGENGKARKYESPCGRGNRAYFPPGIADAIADPSRPVIVTEGEKKSLKSVQEGFTCIGLVGVYGFQKARSDKKKPRELIDDLAEIPWAGRTVHIVYDSDAAQNDNVLWAEWHLAETLMRHGARVRVVRLPSGLDGSKVGLDDYLVSHSAAEFQKLLDAAAPARKPERETPPPAIWVAELEDILRRQKYLARRSPDLRKPHQFCGNLQTGLFQFPRNPKQGENTKDIALTHSCGKPSRCEPCASFDRDRRYGDFEYAVGTRDPGRQLYYFEAHSEQEWKNFRRQQLRAADRKGDLVRRWEGRGLNQDDSLTWHAITPIPHREATSVSTEEARKIVRQHCDDMHSRGARRTTVRCWGAWKQERPEPTLRRLFRSIEDTAEIETFLRFAGVEYEVSLCLRGNLYRRLDLHYKDAAQRDLVRQWFHERDRQRKKSQSEVLPTDRDTTGRAKGFDFHQFDHTFDTAKPRRRRSG